MEENKGLEQILERFDEWDARLKEVAEGVRAHYLEREKAFELKRAQWAAEDEDLYRRRCVARDNEEKMNHFITRVFIVFAVIGVALFLR